MLLIANDDSWRELVGKLRVYVARHAPREDVDDIVQDVLLRIHQNIARLEDRERLGPWVYRIAKNALIDRARTRGTSLRVNVTQLDDTIATESGGDHDGHDDEDDDAQRALVACVAPFIARLPDGMREAVVLTELEGLTQEEAAGMLGLSVSGAKSRVQRGRKRLRAMFEACCAFTQDARGHVMECSPHSDERKAK